MMLVGFWRVLVDFEDFFKGLGWFRRVLDGFRRVSCFWKVLEVVGEFWRVSGGFLIGFGGFRRVLEGCGGFRRDCEVFGGFWRVLEGLGECRQVSEGFGRFWKVLFQVQISLNQIKILKPLLLLQQSFYQS